MANKQPFYENAMILFTTTRPISEDELQEALDYGLRHTYGEHYIEDSAMVQELNEAEPGDPADLM